MNKRSSPPLGDRGAKHINKPFEVCLLPVLPLPDKIGKTTEKVGGKQGLKTPNIIGAVLYTLRGKNRKNDERYYW